MTYLLTLFSKFWNKIKRRQRSTYLENCCQLVSFPRTLKRPCCFNSTFSFLFSFSFLFKVNTEELLQQTQMQHFFSLVMTQIAVKRKSKILFSPDVLSKEWVIVTGTDLSNHIQGQLWIIKPVYKSSKGPFKNDVTGVEGKGVPKISGKKWY